VPDIPPSAEAIAKQLPTPTTEKSVDGLGSPSIAQAMDDAERKVDEIEMMGEELAAKLPVLPGADGVTPGMRYLHASRTIHQLVTDRNRAVGMYLAVATLLWTASTALLNAKPTIALIVPIEVMQLWCIPVTLGLLTVLALFTAFLLVRTRIGLIYEVAKMNALLGLPVGRVQRVNVLSIFFIMHLFICLCGGGTSLLFLYHLLKLGDIAAAGLWASLGGLLTFAALVAVYIVTVLITTSDKKLNGLK
jgi:hypothetical protein